MPVYMSSLNQQGDIYTHYTITLCVCVCVCVRKTLEAGSLVVLSTRQCRLLLNKYGLRVSLLGNSTLGQAHTHKHRVIVYICSPVNSMTTRRPVSVLLLIYDQASFKLIQYYLSDFKNDLQIIPILGCTIVYRYVLYKQTNTKSNKKANKINFKRELTFKKNSLKNKYYRKPVTSKK